MQQMEKDTWKYLEGPGNKLRIIFFVRVNQHNLLIYNRYFTGT